MLGRPRLTYANVTSTLALVLALGGGAAYANHEFIDSSDVADNSLTGADIRGVINDPQLGTIDGTITSEDIADGFVFPADIADNSLGPQDIAGIGGSDIAPGSIGSGHVSGDALNGGHVANDSLDGFDVNNLSGADLIDGSVSAADLARDARGFSVTAERIARRSLDRGDRRQLVASCRENERVTGGGFSSNSGSHPEDIVIQASYRYTNRSWIVIAKHVGGPGSPRIQLVATAQCAR